MKFKKLVSALTLGTVFSSLALGTVSCLDAGAQEEIDKEFLDGWNLNELESQKEKIRFESDSIRLQPNATCDMPIIYEEGNITYDYASSDREIAVVVEKDGKAIICSQNKTGEVTITVRSSNNKVGYLKVIVGEPTEETVQDGQAGASSGLSKNGSNQALPESIIINGKEGVKDLTVIEGESVILTPALSPLTANGLWRIYWYYNDMDGYSHMQAESAGYFQFKLIDSSSKTELSDDGFWKDGNRMGYKVQVVGIQAGEGRKLVAETVDGVKIEINVKVIAKEAQEAIPNIQVIGNKGNSVEMTGLSTSYITAAAYPSTDNGMTFTATSLTPEICTIPTENSTFLTGEMAVIKAEGIGTGYVKVSMGRASQIVKVVVNNEYIQCLGNIQFSVHSTKNVDGGNNTQYPKQRVLPDDENSQAFGTYFPTSANAIYEGAKGVNFLAEAYSTSDSSGYNAVTNVAGTVEVFKNGYFVTKEFKMERKFMKKSGVSYNALGGNTLYVGPDTEVDKDSEDNAAKRLTAASGKQTSSISFAIHNRGANETNSEWKTSIASGDKLLTSSSTTTKDTSKSPIFFVMDTGDNDITTKKAQITEDKYTNVSLDDANPIYVKKTSILSQYKETSNDNVYSELPHIIEESYSLPIGLYYPTPKKNPIVDKDTGITTTYSYSFKGWYLYDNSSGAIGSTKITENIAPDGNVKIIVAKYEETANEESNLS